MAATARMGPALCSSVVPGIGEGRNLPAPSGINTKPEPVQAAIAVAILAGILAGAALIQGPIFDAVRGTGLWIDAERRCCGFAIVGRQVGGI